MAHIVTEPCVGCRHTVCVDVCPVDCFHHDEEKRMLVINPFECIDCGACIPECPEEAIFVDTEMPEKYAEWEAINRERAEVTPVLFERLDPLNEGTSCKD